MRHRIAIGVLFGFSLCSPLTAAQDAAPDREPPDGELRRMLVDPPDARPGFPRVDAPEFTLHDPKPVERFDPSRPAQKLLLKDVDPSKMDYSLGGRSVVGLRSPRPSDWYAPYYDMSLLERTLLRDVRMHAPVTIIWLIDESRSMHDDREGALREMRRAISQLGELNENVRRALEKIGGVRKGERQDPYWLTHLVGGFGQSFHFVTPAPVKTADEAFDSCGRLTIDESGIENPFHAMTSAIREAQPMVPAGTRLVLVLMTDESGNDEDYLEEAVQALKSANAQVYVLGHDALFSKTRLRLRGAFPESDERAQPTIRRGPESADFEALLWDGLHEREDEQPAGCEPYALGRLVKETGGFYSWLPSLEVQRGTYVRTTRFVRAILDYEPELVPRDEYHARRERSPLRRALYDTIQATRDFSLPLHFPFEPMPLPESLADAADKAERQRLQLIPIEAKLRALRDERAIEPSKRWQANYDLMLAQIVAFQVTLREYRAAVYALQRQVKGVVPGPPAAWVFAHGRLRHAPRESTEAAYEEAERLLKQVIGRHADTPWAALAESIRDRGLSVEFREAHPAGPPGPMIERVNY